MGYLVIPSVNQSESLSLEAVRMSLATMKREMHLALLGCCKRSLASSTARGVVWKRLINLVPMEVRQEMLDLAQLAPADSPPADFTFESMFGLARTAINNVWARNLGESKTRVAFPGCDRHRKNPDAPAQAPALVTASPSSPAKRSGGDGTASAKGAPTAGAASNGWHTVSSSNKAQQPAGPGCGMCRNPKAAPHMRDACPTHILKTKCTIAGCPGDGTGVVARRFMTTARRPRRRLRRRLLARAGPPSRGRPSRQWLWGRCPRGSVSLLSARFRVGTKTHICSISSSV